MATQTSFKWNQAVLNQVRSAFTQGMVKMGYAIANQARANAPVLSGALRNSIRTTLDGKDDVYVIAGGHAGSYTVPYAKRREYENNAHPSKRMYMHKAFNKIKSGDISQYFRGRI